MEDTLTLYPSPRWRLLSSTFHLTAVVVLAFCLARRKPFCILPKPHTLKLDASVALQSHGQHDSHQSRPPPALPPLHKPIPPLKAITSSLRAKLSAFRVVTTFTRFTSWTTIFTSFAFALTVAIFGTGVGLDRNSQSLTPMSDLQPTTNCRGAIYASVTLYVLTKIFVYTFLIERVHIVSFGMIAICVYIVIFALMIHGRVVELATPSWFLESLESQPGFQTLPTLPAVCIIGLKVYAAIPLLAYDVIASIALTVMFVVPLVTVGRVDLHSAGVEQNIMPPEATSPDAQDNLGAPVMAVLPPLPSSQKARASSVGSAVEGMEDESILPRWGRVHRERLRSLAKKSCLATIAALACSTVNIIVLIQRGGRETGWIFLLWGTLDVTVNAVAVFFMTGGSVDRDYDRRPSIRDIGPSSYPLTVVPSSVPAVCAASVARLPWMRDASGTNISPDSPSTDESDVLPLASPRSRFSWQSTSHYQGSVIGMLPSPKRTPQARGSSASEEQVHLKPHQPRKSAESNSPQRKVMHAKFNKEEDIVGEQGAMGDLSSRWWAPSPPAVIPEGEVEKMRIPDSKVGASSSSQWRIRDSRMCPKRWSLPH